jgi:hypothetical protein
MKDKTDDERDLTAELDELRRIHAKAASSSPPPGLDQAILARSRQAVRTAASPRRWWIPASVAATALIAFSLVTQIQHEAADGPPETNVVTAPPPAVVSAERSREQAPPVVAAEPSPAPAAAAPATAPPAVQADAATSKRTMPPRQAMPRRAPVPTGGDELQTGAAVALQESAIAAPAAEKAGRLATPRTPEAWLERIEALEAEGRTEEAARERILLEEAYPGWLADRARPH